MLFKFKLLLFICIIGFFTGCAMPEVDHSKSISLLIKSKILKVNDAGFIHFYKNYTNVQIYNSGKSVLNLNIKDKICINNACENKTEFNKKFFLNAHYEDLLEDILEARAIYDGKNLVKTNCGFEQNLRNISVEYKICGGKVRFTDQKNGIKIVMKELN